MAASASAARNAVKELVLGLRRIDIAAQAGEFDKAEAEYQSFSNQTFIAVPALLKKAQPWTLFNSGVSDAHYGVMRQMLQSSNGQALNGQALNGQTLNGKASNGQAPNSPAR